MLAAAGRRQARSCPNTSLGSKSARTASVPRSSGQGGGYASAGVWRHPPGRRFGSLKPRRVNSTTPRTSTGHPIQKCNICFPSVGKQEYIETVSTSGHNGAVKPKIRGLNMFNFLTYHEKSVTILGAHHPRVLHQKCLWNVLSPSRRRPPPGIFWAGPHSVRSSGSMRQHPRSWSHAFWRLASRARLARRWPNTSFPTPRTRSSDRVMADLPSSHRRQRPAMREALSRAPPHGRGSSGRRTSGQFPLSPRAV